MKALTWLGLLFSGVILSAGELKKAAVLHLPAQIEFRSGGGSKMTGEVEFRWEEKESLHLGLFRAKEAGGKDSVAGAIDVFDERGGKLDKIIYVTLPPIPNKEVVINKGEVRRFGLWEMYSTVIFPRPGNYYAVADFDYGYSDGKTVSFKTSKRWFKVVEAPDKKNSL